MLPTYSSQGACLRFGSWKQGRVNSGGGRVNFHLFPKEHGLSYFSFCSRFHPLMVLGSRYTPVRFAGFLSWLRGSPCLPHLLRFLIFQNHPPFYSYKSVFLVELISCGEKKKAIWSNFFPERMNDLGSSSPHLKLTSTYIVQLPHGAAAAFFQGHDSEPDDFLRKW